MADAPIPSDPLAPFRVKRCLKCDYDLAGLPADHTCPECGEPCPQQALELVGWSQLGFVVGTISWHLHLWVYVMVGLVAFTVAWGVGGALGGPWASLLPLGFCTLVACLILARVRLAMQGSNLRLLVTEDLVIVDTSYTSILQLALREPDEKFDLGSDLCEVRVRLRHADTWELRLSTGSIRSFRVTEMVRIILHCDEAEAHALAEELRARIRHATCGREGQEAPIGE